MFRRRGKHGWREKKGVNPCLAITKWVKRLITHHGEGILHWITRLGEHFQIWILHNESQSWYKASADYSPRFTPTLWTLDPWKKPSSETFRPQIGTPNPQTRPNFDMFLDPRLFGNSFNKCRPWRALLRFFCGHDLAMAVDHIEIPSQWWWTWCWKQTQRARQTDSTPTFVKKPSPNRCYSLVKIIIHPNYIIYIYIHIRTYTVIFVNH